MATRLSQWNKAAPALIEQRGAIRYRARVTRCHTIDDAAERSATLHDVSTYGCRLAMDEAVPVGERLTIAIGATLPIEAQVMWAEGGMIGCRFSTPLARALSRALTLGIHPIAG